MTNMAGTSGAEPDLEKFRPYLLTLARCQMTTVLRARFDAEDVVQDTLLEALKGLHRHRGRTEAELAAWLRTILARNLIDHGRKLDAQRRKAALEQSMDATLTMMSLRLRDVLADGGTSVSGKVIRHETMMRLADALARLPERQRLAVEMHHLQGFSFKETAAMLETTPAAVASLVVRGLRGLRELMPPDDRM